MHTTSGGCHCGNIRVDLELSAPSLDAYHPRACDCDFCRKHGAAWLSDANGSLLIQINDPIKSGEYRQGSGQAEFLLCRNCGVLVCALYRNDRRLYAVVNAKTVEDAAKFGIEQAVSPKKLSADEKANRWEALWFSNVEIRKHAHSTV